MIFGKLCVKINTDFGRDRSRPMKIGPEFCLAWSRPVQARPEFYLVWPRPVQARCITQKYLRPVQARYITEKYLILTDANQNDIRAVISYGGFSFDVLLKIVPNDF